MTDELKKIYAKEKLLHRYFDGEIPKNLFRGRRTGDSTDLMQPSLLGWYRGGQKKIPRRPDVLLEDAKGASPQFKDVDHHELVVKSEEGIKQILADADKFMVKGCRCVKGDYRGVSVFDKRNKRLRNFDWYLLPKGTPLPDALACTRDSDLVESKEPIHHTIAPKDDMSLSLFLQHLKGLAAAAKKD